MPFLPFEKREEELNQEGIENAREIAAKMQNYGFTKEEAIAWLNRKNEFKKLSVKILKLDQKLRNSEDFNFKNMPF